MHYKALDCRSSRRRSIPGVSDLCPCGDHAVPDAGDVRRRGNHAQILGAYERHGVVCDGERGHRQVRPPVERQGGRERAGGCLRGEQRRAGVRCDRYQVPRHGHRAGAVDRLLRRGLRQRGQGSCRVPVEGELAFYHGKSCRAANPDSYADYSYAHADYSYAHATDPHAHAYPYDSRAHPDSYDA